jgi:predicted metalloprotease with PDZ domain
VKPEAFWHDLVEGVPQGLPEPGDQGLDRTDTWGRRYWGGALFYFVADLRIREQTKNARSLDDALRGVAATGATVEDHWSIEQFLEVADRATGTHVMADLYKAWALAPEGVDLAAIWQRLGVRIVARGEAGFDDSAPLANVRRAITSSAR